MDTTCILRTTAFLAVALISSVASAAELTIELQNGLHGYDGTIDTGLSADPRYLDRNLGERPGIGIWQHDEVALIRFDLSQIPRTAMVSGASLELFLSSVGHSDEEVAREWPVTVYEFNHAWTEGTGRGVDPAVSDGATFATFDGAAAWPMGIVTASAGRELSTEVIPAGLPQQWFKWRVAPALVQEWLDNREQNRGFMVWGKPPGKAVAFHSSECEDPGMRPVLRLALSVPDRDVALLGRLAASDIGWDQFLADCGLAAQEENEARTEEAFRRDYRDRIVEWTGRVDSVSESLTDGFTVGVAMDPTESILGSSDLWLSVPPRMRQDVLALNKGDKITFVARIQRQGGRILNHSLDLLSLVPNAESE